MSQTELHIGKLKCLTKWNGKKLAEEILKGNDTLKWSDDRYLDQGFIEEKKDWKYRYYLYKEHLYEIEKSYEGESDGYIQQGTKLENGDIDFVLEFYNGGTCEAEMLEELIENLHK